MSAARLVLERSTIMLLTSSKVRSRIIQVQFCYNFQWLFSQTSLRHPECTYSKENRDTVFCQMRRAMDLIHYVVKDGVLESTNERSLSRQVRNSPILPRNDLDFPLFLAPLALTRSLARSLNFAFNQSSRLSSGMLKGIQRSHV